MKKLFSILLIIGFMNGTLYLGYAGQPSQYKTNAGDARWNVKLNAGLDALWDSFSSLSSLVTNWVTTENQDILIPGCTYSSGTNFTVAGDYTAQFAANAKVRVDLGAGTLKGSYVASSSYGAGTTTVVLHDSILTNPLSGVWVTATRSGLFPYGPGYVVARDYGVPGTTAFDAALDVIGTSYRTLILTPGNWGKSTSPVPANVNLKIESGAYITTAGQVINGSLEAGPYAIISGSGTITLGSLVYLRYGEWDGSGAGLNVALSGSVVTLIGDQTVAGIKTFSSFPITPSSAPTTDYQVANKKFVLDHVPPIPVGSVYYNTTGVNPATELGYGTWVVAFIITNMQNYPPLQDDAHVKATEQYLSFSPYFSTDPALSVTGDMASNQWLENSITNQRFNIDYGSPIVIANLYYENSHDAGGSTGSGVKTFTMWGTNSGAAFADVTWITDGAMVTAGWTKLTTGQSTFDQHVAFDQADPKYMTVTNSVAYRYYGFKFVDTWTDAETLIGIRRLELYSLPVNLWVRTN